MEDFSIDDCAYIYEGLKSIHSAYFFRMSSRDLARFGLLYQHYGNWEGRQIVPEIWIRESTKIYHVENRAGDPYGYLWRIFPEDAGYGHAFYHPGMGVHLLAVIVSPGKINKEAAAGRNWVFHDGYTERSDK